MDAFRLVINKCSIRAIEGENCVICSVFTWRPITNGFCTHNGKSSHVKMYIMFGLSHIASSAFQKWPTKHTYPMYISMYNNNVPPFKVWEYFYSFPTNHINIMRKTYPGLGRLYGSTLYGSISLSLFLFFFKRKHLFPYKTEYGHQASG